MPNSLAALVESDAEHQFLAVATSLQHRHGTTELALVVTGDGHVVDHQSRHGEQPAKHDVGEVERERRPARPAVLLAPEDLLVDQASVVKGAGQAEA